MSKKISELKLTTSVGENSYIPVVVDGTTMRVMVKVLKENLSGNNGGGSSPLDIVYTTNDLTEFTCNMSFEEIYEALISGSRMATITISLGGVTTLAKSNLWSFIDNSQDLDGAIAFVFSCDAGPALGFIRIIHYDVGVIVCTGLEA